MHDFGQLKLNMFLCFSQMSFKTANFSKFLSQIKYKTQCPHVAKYTKFSSSPG